MRTLTLAKLHYTASPTIDAMVAFPFFEPNHLCRTYLRVDRVNYESLRLRTP
jgi:hypothetical protein